MKNKYNIKELEEKINRCKSIKLEDINPDDVEEAIKISEPYGVDINSVSNAKNIK